MRTLRNSAVIIVLCIIGAAVPFKSVKKRFKEAAAALPFPVLRPVHEENYFDQVAGSPTSASTPTSLKDGGTEGVSSPPRGGGNYYFELSPRQDQPISAYKPR